MRTIELSYDDENVAPGAVVGAVEIIDETLAVVAETVIRAGRGVRVDVRRGRHLVRGWLPAGDAVSAVVEDSACPTDMPVRLRRRDCRRESEPVDPISDAWLCGWHATGSEWRPEPTPDFSVKAAAEVDVVMPTRAGTSSLAVQVWRQGAAAHIAIVPASVPIRLNAMGEGWRLSLPTGIESTLLGYLHNGAFSAARVVANEAMRDGPDPDQSLLGVAVGYYLVRSGHEAAEEWVRELAWSQPYATDVAVLKASLLRRTATASDAEIRDELLRAASSGLPLVANGLRLLSDGLAAASGDVSVSASIARVHGYLAALADGPLTAFRGEAPGMPSLHPVSRSESGPGIARVPPAQDVDLSRLEPPRSGRPPIREVREAFRLLQAEGVGSASFDNRFGVGDLSLGATVARRDRPDSFDLELRLLSGARFNGLLVDLQADSLLHCLGRFDTGNTCSFTDVPAGNWEFSVRDEIDLRTMQLPQAVAAVGASTGPDESVELVRIVLPGNKCLLVLRQDGRQRHRLDVTVVAEATPKVLLIEHQLVGGRGSRRRAVPVRRSAVSPASASIWLKDLDDRSPWQIVTEDASTADLLAMTGQDLQCSVTFAASRSTRRAWRALAESLPSPAAQVITECLADEH